MEKLSSRAMLGAPFKRQTDPFAKKKAGLASGLRGDEVKYAFTEALRRAARPTWGRCPSRAASKTSMPTLNEQRNFKQHIL
jgi:hypothetical protein